MPQTKYAPGQILPGIKPVLEILSNCPERVLKICCNKNRYGDENSDLYLACQNHGVQIEFVSTDFLNSICSNANASRKPVAHQGVAAIVTDAQFITLTQLFDFLSSSPLGMALALDQIQDPGNLGTICRTAYALGCAGIILPKHNTAAIGVAAARASAGTIYKLPLVMATNLAKDLDKAEERGITLYGATCQKETPNSGRKLSGTVDAFHCKWQKPCILVLGNEERGIRPGVAKRCNFFVNIPFARKFDSINVAQAAAIFMSLFAMDVANK